MQSAALVYRHKQAAEVAVVQAAAAQVPGSQEVEADTAAARNLLTKAASQAVNQPADKAATAAVLLTSQVVQAALPEVEAAADLQQESTTANQVV